MAAIDHTDVPEAAAYRTDPAGWRLVVGADTHGQQKWTYLPPGPERDAWPQTVVDKYSQGLEIDAPEIPPARTPLEAARNGLRFYRQLQSPDGHFAHEYGGPLFLAPGLIIAMHVTGQSLRQEQKHEIIRYILNVRRPEGGWGLHTAAPPTVYGTVMNYVMLRLLGMGPDEGPMTEIRALMHKMGGATGLPTWGKVWLSILGCYDWKGVNPVPPEIWLLPDWVPFAPWRWWVHVRYVFTPMSYLWATRFTTTFTPIVFALRQELYTQPYDSIAWNAQRNHVAAVDIYSPHHPVLDILDELLVYYESLPSLPLLPSLRDRAIKRAYQHVVWEDENTGYQTLAPVSKAFNMVVRFAVDGPDSDAMRRHAAVIDDFFWLSRRGLFVTGTNGSQLWDLAFLAQAVTETRLADEDNDATRALVGGALDWLDKCQIRTLPPYWKESYRQPNVGTWPFSTPTQSYTVSDCTAEGLKAVMALQALSYTAEPVGRDRMRQAVDVMLVMQNPDGGYASYERMRGSSKLEWLNAAEVFGNIMVDYEYPECTTSVLSALKHFSKLDPTYRAAEIESCVSRAIRWIHGAQRPDGSWYGSWAICFTYATMFALEALGIAGESCANSERVRRACRFLLDRQMDDGGWGETYLSCVTGEYSQHADSQVVQTAWSILALVYARSPDAPAIRRACALIMARQRPDGRWDQEDTEGIFNKNCAIDYPSFKFVFSIWALGRADRYLRELEGGA
ncbi:Lanosterol synthase (Oxidosqualene--lanosterol cyclase) [Cryptotrichosporon argae]